MIRETNRNKIHKVYNHINSMLTVSGVYCSSRNVSNKLKFQLCKLVMVITLNKTEINFFWVLYTVSMIFCYSWQNATAHCFLNFIV